MLYLVTTNFLPASLRMKIRNRFTFISLETRNANGNYNANDTNLCVICVQTEIALRSASNQPARETVL